MFKKYKHYIISVAASLAVGGLSALATRGNMDIYDEISKPPLSPPSWLFPVVWGILYALMGISSGKIYKIIQSDSSLSKTALVLYAVSLGVNFFWSVLFFNLKAFLFSSIWLILLMALILTTITEYCKLKPWTAYLQIPYFLWCSFALYLNISIYILN